MCPPSSSTSDGVQGTFVIAVLPTALEYGLTHLHVHNVSNDVSKSDIDQYAFANFDILHGPLENTTSTKESPMHTMLDLPTSGSSRPFCNTWLVHFAETASSSHGLGGVRHSQSKGAKWIQVKVEIAGHEGSQPRINKKIGKPVWKYVRKTLTASKSPSRTVGLIALEGSRACDSNFVQHVTDLIDNLTDETLRHPSRALNDPLQSLVEIPPLLDSHGPLVPPI